jgi:hypothetical protein
MLSTVVDLDTASECARADFSGQERADSERAVREQLRGEGQGSLRDKIILFQRLGNGGEVQTFKALHFNYIVLQPPMLSLQRDDVVDIFEQARNCVCQWTTSLRNVPQDICRR